MDNYTPGMLATFEANCKLNFDKLAELLKTYDLAKLGYDMQRQQEKDCHTEALNNGDYHAAKDCPRAGIKAGDRITDEIFSFLLSKEDFIQLSSEYLPLLVKNGIIDEKGHYLTDWLTIKGDARRELVSFIISEILPDELRREFQQARMNVTHECKVIDIIRPIVCKPSNKSENE